MPSHSHCVACGQATLEPHLKLRHEMGEDGLIPTTTQFGAALGDIWRCSRCGHMQLDPMPGAAILDTAYEAAASKHYVDEEAVIEWP